MTTYIGVLRAINIGSHNRIAMADNRRLELAEHYWSAAHDLWPLLERRFTNVTHPLSGEALDCAKAALSLSHELGVAYKHLLSAEADRRKVIGGSRQLSMLLQRALDSLARAITHSYVAYAPVPPKTWLDLHRIYAFARDRGVHLDASPGADALTTPERTYLQVLLLALANPYGMTNQYDLSRQCRPTSSATSRESSARQDDGPRAGEELARATAPRVRCLGSEGSSRRGWLRADSEL